MSQFWQRLFMKTRTRLAFTYAHHQSANSQVEHTIQTIQHAFRYAIGNRYDPQDWDKLPPYIQYCLNTSQNASTGVSPFQFLFGRDPKPIFADNPEELDFLASRERLRAKAADTVKLA